MFVCFLLNQLVGEGLRFLQRDSEGPLAGRQWHKVPDHLPGLSPRLCSEQRRIQVCTWHFVCVCLCMCVCPHVCLCAQQRP